MTSPRYLELQKDPQSAADPELHPVSLHRQAGGRTGSLSTSSTVWIWGAEDFAHPGTRIEEEMAPYIQTALSESPCILVM